MHRGLTRGRSRAHASRRRAIAILATALLLAPALLAGFGAHAEDREIARRRAAQRMSFTDAEIADGFFKTAFGAEFNLAKPSDRIRKYVTPVRVYVENQTPSQRPAQVARIIADIRSRIAGLDIAMTENQANANVIIRLVRERALRPTIRAIFGAAQERRIQNSLDPQCLSGFAKDAEYRIQRSDVILPVDAGEFIFFDCAYEETLQALGPINDTASVPWTMFNDDVQMGFFDVYDQLLLNILYHPRVKPGMTAADVRAILPEVLPEVRSFVSAHNPSRRHAR